MTRKRLQFALGPLAMAATAGICLAFGALGAWGAASTSFQADFEGCTVGSPTSLANLALGTSAGSWTGNVGASSPTNAVSLDTLGANKLLLLDAGAPNFDVQANLTAPVTLGSGSTTVSFKFAPRRSGNNRYVEITGEDGSGNVSFKIRLYTQLNPTTMRFEWFDGATWAATGSHLIEASQVADPPVSANLATITLNLSASNYTLTYAPGANLAPTVSGYTTAALTYVTTPLPQLSLIRFLSTAPSSNSGVWMDDIVVAGESAANQAPSFNADPFSKPDATEGSAYSQTIASDASDPDAGNILTFAKVSGPSWLSVAGNGALTGTPSAGDVGLNVFTVSVTDGIIPAPVTATMNITVGTTQPPSAAKTWTRY
ncbi:MAG: putative Ig domain-containing protein [Candidatus Sumerlaeota bacterium]|nr:putative Ig domain-containing protein [Candidatus Sumerlaeota bacterium]